MIDGENQAARGGAAGREGGACMIEPAREGRQFTWKDSMVITGLVLVFGCNCNPVSNIVFNFGGGIIF